MSVKIFVSYRHSDAQFIADKVVDFLGDYFGDESIFRDIDSTPLASDFESVINENLKGADVFIAIVTSDYFRAEHGEGGLRIHDPSDYVRHEIRVALHRKIPLIPFVVHPATMPASSDLPEELVDFCRKQAQIAYPGAAFGVSLLQLVEGLFQGHFGYWSLRTDRVCCGRFPCRKAIVSTN